MTRQDRIAALWHGRDPFADPPADLRAGDLQGWRSIHPYLEEAVIEFRPRVDAGVQGLGGPLSATPPLRD